MPWRVADVDKYSKGLTRKQKRTWVNIANSILKSCQAKDGDDCEEKAIKQANGVISRQKEKAMAARKVAEAKITKKVKDQNLAASAFLIVEDPEKPATWHMPVKDAEGKPDHKLMGAAYAALTKKYKGAGKTEALAKLKKMYTDEELELPSAEAAEAMAAEISEMYGDVYPAIYVPSDVVTFGQLEDAEQANDIMREVQELTDKFFTLTRNILYYYPMGGAEIDRLAGMRSLVDEYMERLAGILQGEADEPDEPENTGDEETKVTANTEAASTIAESEKLTESEAGSIVNLSEMPAAGEVLKLDVAIIRPGWGNKVDKHYYPKEMLEQYSERFVGAKMYESDHRPEEKSTRTWVSTITEISGYTDDGAPIGRVAVHDPDFAARLRNLAEAKLLDRMECSILATGKAQPFEMDGIKGKKVTEIMEVESVDWVTRAGAGGKALNLAESEPKVQGGSNVMDGTQEVTTPTTPEAEAPTAPVTEPAAETVPNTQSTNEAAPEQLGEAEILQIVSASSLPEVSRKRMIASQYANAQALQEAITGEIAYLKEATGSGQVVGLGETQTPKPAYDAKAVAEAADRVNKKYFNIGG